MKSNTSLTELDLRWNFSGEKTDYVEQAVLDLQRYQGLGGFRLGFGVWVLDLPHLQRCPPPAPTALPPSHTYSAAPLPHLQRGQIGSASGRGRVS